MRGLLLLVLLLVLGLPAAAQTGWRAEFLFPRHRHDAPVPLHLTLPASPQLEEVEVVLRVVEQNRVYAEVVLGPVALGPTPLRLAPVLPPLVGQPEGSAELAVSLRTPAGERSLGAIFLDYIAPHDGDSQIELALCGVGEEAESVLDQLVKPADRNDAQPLRAVGLIAADALPSTPMAYGALDLLVLRGRDSLRLRDAQRRAIGAWVRAGGQLWVVLDGLDPATARWACGLIGADPAAPLRLAGLSRCDHGRLGLAADANQLATLVATRPGTTRPMGTRLAPWSRLPPQLATLYFARVLDHLPLERFEAIPFGKLVAMYAAFLYLIGLLDGWVLRRFSRRITWLWFPAWVAVAFAVIHDLPRRTYAGLADRQRLRIEDLGADGTALRCRELILGFPAQTEALTLERTGPTAVVPLERAEPERAEPERAEPARAEGARAPDRWRPTALDSGRALEHRGAVDRRHGVVVPVRQWSPVLLAQEDWGVLPEPGGPDWPALAAVLAGTPMDALLAGPIWQRLRNSMPLGARVLIFDVDGPALIYDPDLGQPAQLHWRPLPGGWYVPEEAHLLELAALDELAYEPRRGHPFWRAHAPTGGRRVRVPHRSIAVGWRDADGYRIQRRHFLVEEQR